MIQVQHLHMVLLNCTRFPRAPLDATRSLEALRSTRAQAPASTVPSPASPSQPDPGSLCPSCLEPPARPQALLPGAPSPLAGPPGSEQPAPLLRRSWEQLELGTG